MRNKLLTVVSICIAVAICSCAKLNSLSTSNEMRSFRVISHYPDEIVIDQPEITQDTIFIPVIYGKYQFPLHLTKVEYEVSPLVNKVVGIDFSKEIVLDSITHAIPFFVVAESGSTHKYILAPKEIPLEENNLIFGRVNYASVSPANTLIFHKPAIDNKARTLLLNVAEPEFPLTITPGFTIAPTSHFGNITSPAAESQPFENGATELTFESADTHHLIEVTSQSGNTTTWDISLDIYAMADPTTAADPRSDGTYLNPRELKVADAAGFTVEETIVDNQGSILSYITVDPAAVWPLGVNLKMGLKSWNDILYASADTTFLFNDKDEVKTFYICDVMDTHTVREWKFSLAEYKSSYATVTGFTYGTDITTVATKWSSGWISTVKESAASIFMDAQKRVIINSQNKHIDVLYDKYTVDDQAVSISASIPVTTWWGLTLKNIGITLSSGATSSLSSSSTMEWKANAKNQAANLVKQSREFTVTAPDGTVHTWTLNLLKADDAQSSECEIKNILINRTVPDYVGAGLLFEQEQRDNKEIIFPLANDKGAYPLRIFSDMIISDLASITTQSNGSQPLIFNDATSEVIITVKAQDGTESDYTAKLLPPAGGSDAIITDVTLGQMPSRWISLKEPSIDEDKREITLHLTSDDAPFPVEIRYNSITLSDEDAQLTIPPRGTFTFASPTSRFDIWISGQDDSWSVKLDYRPQLYNAGIDLWSGNFPNNTAYANNRYWGTSNVTTVISLTVVTPGVGSSGNEGDKCAVLKTGKAPIVNKLASGSLFVGWFDGDNSLNYGVNDPVRLTFFGRPLGATAKIKGFEFDVNYTAAGGANGDWCSAAINFARNTGGANYVYHGVKPNTGNPSDGASPHTTNTATFVDGKKIFFGNGDAKTAYNDPVHVIPAGVWQRQTVYLDGGRAIDPSEYTHMYVTFASSAYGDYFIGKEGSTMMVDNIRIIYED